MNLDDLDISDTDKARLTQWGGDWDVPVAVPISIAVAWWLLWSRDEKEFAFRALNMLPGKVWWPDGVPVGVDGSTGEPVG